ncbi:MAG: hypothetical protein LBQ57_03530 [Spirochaetales bacterium]|jgi:hypothetical protein|nr:hypothetical protein [Spirochaetales bacterium]
MKKTLCAAAILLCAFPLLAASPVTDIELLRQEARALVKNGTRWLEIDSNNDGGIDHVMLLARNGDKIYEEIDMNHDGIMDDLCYYKNGVIIREETDTNYDGKIDLWVFIREGVYVERYAQDKDFDGIIDITKEYGAAKR